MSLSDAFRKNLLAYRLAANISQTELAERSGVPLSTIARYENGERKPGIDQVERLAKGLNIPFYLLLERPPGATASELHRLMDSFTRLPAEERERVVQYAELQRAFYENPQILRRPKT